MDRRLPVRWGAVPGSQFRSLLSFNFHAETIEDHIDVYSITPLLLLARAMESLLPSPPQQPYRAKLIVVCHYKFAAVTRRAEAAFFIAFD